MLTIFDCDGVLVDSEVLASHIFAATLGFEGIAVTPEYCLKNYKGLTLHDCLQAVEQAFGRPLTPDFLARLKHETELGFAQSLMPVPGVENVLAWLREGSNRMCVASNGGKSKIRHSLTITGLADYFDHCFSAEEVARGKPAPDLFQLAADSLGVPSIHCVVIEDSLTGVQAARAAGMRVLFYGENDAIASLGDVPTFTHMGQLPGLLQKVWLEMTGGL